MPQISKYPLHQDLIKEINSQFVIFLSKISVASDMQAFLLDFLTETEGIMLAKRYMIMVLLMRGYKSVDIKSILNVSNSAINSVASWLRYPSPTTGKLLQRINNTQNLHTISDKVEELLDKLPPPKYRNWSNVGKEKIERARSRAIRSKLR